MSTFKPALPVAIVLGTLALMSGYILIDAHFFALIAFGVALAWFVGIQLELRWISPLAFFLFWVLIVIGSFVKVGVIWLAIGMVSVLAAWQLAHFTHQMANYEDNAALNLIAGRHLNRLMLVSTLSIVLIGFSLGTKIELSFGLAIALALVAFLGLSRVITYLRS